MRFDSRLTLVAAAFASGCALSPDANRQLEEARAAYRLAAADPQVQLRAQPELQSAANALTDAERMAKAGKASELVEHNAYLAERRARIALRTAETRKAQADIAAAAEERRRVRLESEAAVAREQARQAEMARQEAEARAQQQLQQQSTAAAELAAEVKRLETELADVRAKQTERGAPRR